MIIVFYWRASSRSLGGRCLLVCLRGILWGVLLGASAGATAAKPPVLTDEQLRFVTANAEFSLLHEVGHALIHELQLPVLGREEDAADQLGLIGFFLLEPERRDQLFYAKLVDVADYWRLESQLASEAERVQAWDSHSLDIQRFYNLACLTFGSDPERLEWIVTATGLPDERAFYCDQEYELAQRSVHWLAERFQRSSGSAVREQMRVVYETPREALPFGREMYRRVRESGVLEKVAVEVNHRLALPRPVTLRVSSCSAPDAWYDAQRAEIRLCYERLAHFVELSAELGRLRAARLNGEPPVPGQVTPAEQ